MLGLGLFVAIMALLLGGTLRGLWSYYLTINSIRSKLAELRAAEQFKESVYKLTARATQETREVGAPGELQDQIDKARHKLTAYREQLQDTLDHGRDPGNGELEKQLVEVLSRDFDRFKAAADKVGQPRMIPFGLPDDEQKD